MLQFCRDPCNVLEIHGSLESYMYLISKVVNRLSWQRWGKEKVGRKKIEERGGRREGGGESQTPTPFPPQPLHAQLGPSWPFQLRSDPQPEPIHRLFISTCESQ